MMMTATAIVTVVTMASTTAAVVVNKAKAMSDTQTTIN